MRIILLDTRAHFRDDVRTRLLVDDDRNVELMTDLANSSGLGTAVATFKPELIVVADNVYPEQSNWTSYGIPVVGYLTKSTNPDIFAADGIPAYSNVGGAANLLNLLETGIPAAKTQTPATAQQHQGYQAAPQYGSVSAPTTVSAAPVSAGMYQPMGTPTTPAEAHQRRPQVSFNPPADDEDKPTDIFHGTADWASSQPNTTQNPLPQYPGNQQSNKSGTLQSRNPGAWLYHDEPEYQPMPQTPKVQQPVAPQPMTQQPVVQQPTRYEPPASESYTQQVARPEPAVPQNYNQPVPNQKGFYDPGYPGYSANGMNPMQSPAPVKEQLDENRRIRNDAMTSNAVLNDIAVRNTPTKTVAVYAAKGGVGKTTISTELAVILSMTSRGRGNMRVCLVDYNIDFGDVLTTLNLDNRGSNMSHWAADIRRRIAAGENPDDIQYSRQEIEGRLQRVGNSSLYALVAPIAHEDSMDIRSDEPGIILRNIIENGCFDFVVCDTGNNTRDATVSALDAADTILMVVTQDVSAVNCNKSFLQTMTHVGFDIDKIRLVVNGIMPNKFTQVSVQEVEEMFPYPCIARFKRDPEVTKANNCSEPIVYQPNHEFTKEMRKIVAYLTGQPAEEPVKKSFFSRFRKG